MARESIELIKEQLRAKAREMSRLTSDQAKQEQKVQHLLEVSKQKIAEMKAQLVEKDLQIKRAENLGPSARGSVEIGHAETGGADSGGTTVVEKEVHVKDPKLVKALTKLRKKNEDLSTRIEAETEEKNKLTKEKQLLTLEIQRVKKQPDLAKQMKRKVQEMEERTKQNQDKYERLIKEKQELIDSYEKVLFDATGGQGKKMPSEIIKELKTELEELNKDRDRLERDLMETKRRFDKQLLEKIKEMEAEWGERLKKIKKEKARLVGEIFEEGAEGWMVTYADMVTLLLTFFILYYSIASVNMAKFKEAILGEERASIGLLELLDSAEIKENIQQLTGMKSKDIMEDINEVVEDSQLDIDTSEAKIVVRVPGASLFPSGSADLQKEARPVLDEVIRIVKKYPNYKTHIQGHTDDEPIASERFPTNWELSAARATAVLRYFIDKGIDPKKLTATGYADTFPLATNDSELGRAKNRRVEFVLEKEKK
ncbi:MAG: hypothetical protein COV67_00250 [Nitrospinae bacterium CG11_big_fil_rev_8_21_14_0_20_56_8]|nr:MAG: hypothetical protein COV67_00250 [Nitrospinae bacterium CG11_big_fil_rev_8_21_14_0_20_56_8]